MAEYDSFKTHCESKADFSSFLGSTVVVNTQFTAELGHVYDAFNYSILTKFSYIPGGQVYVVPMGIATSIQPFQDSTISKAFSAISNSDVVDPLKEPIPVPSAINNVFNYIDAISNLKNINPAQAVTFSPPLSNSANPTAADILRINAASNQINSLCNLILIQLNKIVSTNQGADTFMNQLDSNRLVFPSKLTTIISDYTNLGFVAANSISVSQDAITSLVNYPKQILNQVEAIKQSIKNESLQYGGEIQNDMSALAASDSNCAILGGPVSTLMAQAVVVLEGLDGSWLSFFAVLLIGIFGLPIIILASHQFGYTRSSKVQEAAKWGSYDTITNSKDSLLGSKVNIKTSSVDVSKDSLAASRGNLKSNADVSKSSVVVARGSVKETVDVCRFWQSKMVQEIRGQDIEIADREGRI